MHAVSFHCVFRPGHPLHFLRWVFWQWPPSSLCWWKCFWIKQKLYLTSPAQGPDGRLARSQGERWALYLSVPYPIRVSPSITPYIQRMRAAFAKLRAPCRPLFTLLTASILLPFFLVQPPITATRFPLFSLSLLEYTASTMTVVPSTPCSKRKIISANSWKRKIKQNKQLEQEWQRKRANRDRRGADIQAHPSWIDRG